MTSSPSTDSPLSEEQMPDITPAPEQQQPRSMPDPLKLAGVAALAGVGLFGLASKTSLLQPRPTFQPSRDNVDAALKANPSIANRSIQSAIFTNNEAFPGETTAIAPAFSQSSSPDELPTAEQAETPQVTWPNLQRLPGEGSGITQGKSQAVMTPLPIASTNSRENGLALAPQRSSVQPASAKPSTPATATPKLVTPPSSPRSSSPPESTTPLRSSTLANERLNSQPALVAVAPTQRSPIAVPRPANPTLTPPASPAPLPSNSPARIPEATPASTPITSPLSPARDQQRLKFIVGARPSPRFKIPALRRGSSCPSTVEIASVVPVNSAQPNQASVESTMSDQLTVFIHVAHLDEGVKSETRSYKLLLTLQDEQLDQDLYNQEIDLPRQSGIVGIRVPRNSAMLQVGQTYLWQAAVLCDPENPSKNPTANGWVQRQAPKAAPLDLAGQAFFYAEQGVWLDAVNAVMNQYQQNPQQARQDWSDLLDSVNLPKTWSTQPLIWIL